jgi:hypothetical protein
MNLDYLPTGPFTYVQDAWRELHLPRHMLLAGGILLVLLAGWLLFVPRKRKGHVARLGGLTWWRNQFCRGSAAREMDEIVMVYPRSRCSIIRLRVVVSIQ